MEQAKIDRINELAKIKKERELTGEELAEREALRRQYIDEFKGNLKNTLDRVYVQQEDGSYEKLKKKDDNTKT